MNIQFQFQGETMELKISEYSKGHPKAVVLCEDGSPYASLCKPSLPSFDGCLTLDDADHNIPVIKAMINQGILGAMQTFVPSGFKDYGVYPLLVKEDSNEN